MNRDEIIVMEDCKISWEREARARAVEDAKQAGLNPEHTGDLVRGFLEASTAQHYAELAKLGEENIS